MILDDWVDDFSANSGKTVTLQTEPPGFFHHGHRLYDDGFP
jgi:hypothetical protein